MHTIARDWTLSASDGESKMSRNAENNMVKMLRRYAMASLIGMLAAALALAAMYRQLAIRDSIQFQRNTNLVVATNLVNSIKPELGPYLKSERIHGARPASERIFPPSLVSTIAETIDSASLNEIRIYDDQGILVYSSGNHEVGKLDERDFALLRAARRHATSEIVYRDMFSGIGRGLPDDNMLRTAVPVRLGPADAPLATVVTHMDLQPMAAKNEQAVIAFFGAILAVLMILYSILLLVVIRAKKAIESEQNVVRERTTNLEMLSVQLLESEESQKLNLAVNLHEGLAQTLAAIKCRLEESATKFPPTLSEDKSLNGTLSALDGAIEELQEIATDLRPSSLDQLGLLPTIRWFCREFEYLHPDIRIEKQISLLEREIPERLKIVIYRVIEGVLKDIGKSTQKDQIRVSLRTEGSGVVLAIDDVPQIGPPAKRSRNSTASPKARFATVQERVILSGGAFAAVPNPQCGVTLRASWIV